MQKMYPKSEFRINRRLKPDCDYVKSCPFIVNFLGFTMSKYILDKNIVSISTVYTHIN